MRSKKHFSQLISDSSPREPSSPRAKAQIDFIRRIWRYNLASVLKKENLFAFSRK